MKNKFFTFAMDINHIQRQYLIKSVINLTNSLDYFKNNYDLIVYTNIEELKDYKHTCITYKDLSMDSIKSYYTTEYLYHWLNLSFHKLITVDKMTTDTESYIWIDLDTIICRNVDHLVNYKSFFIIQETEDVTPFEIIKNTLSIPNKDYIQGNIWKLDRKLLTSALSYWNTLNPKPEYDGQGLFNLMYHFNVYKPHMPILGRDVDVGTINGLEIQNYKIIKHDGEQDLRDNLYMTDEGIIMDKRSDKQVQFFSFIFVVYQMYLRDNLFSLFKDHKIRLFFKQCGYIN